MKKTRSIRRILGYLKTRSVFLLLSLLLAAVYVYATLRIPILIGNAIDKMVGAGEVDLAAVTATLLSVGTLTAVAAVSQFLMSLCHNRLSFGVVNGVRRDAFRRVQKLPLSYVDSHKVGDVVNRMVADADAFADGLLVGFTQLFTGIVTILATLALMLSIHPVIALAVVLLTPLSLFVARFIASRTHDMFSLQSKIRGEQTAFMNETVENQKTVKAFGRETAMTERFDEISGRLKTASLRATFFSSLTNPSTRFINATVYAAVALLGALSAIGVMPLGATLTVGALTCLLSYANQYTKPFNEISGVITEVQNAFASAERLFDLIDAETETEPSSESARLPRAVGEVSLENVSFAYDKSRPLLKDVSLSVSPGMHIAIVGPTGCGKTTLINLLMRFYDVDQGRITVDGTDIRSVTRESLRENYGMVLQETFLKSGTVRENIAFANPLASDEEIRAAAEAAHASHFIKRLPNGYDTEVGDKGYALSEGQKQLISIARVMLALPPILILDEATSSIDTRTELRIQAAFHEMMQGRTSFIVAHRLSTIRNTDLILVMKDGNIVEQGSHEDLLARGGFYSTLYHSQFES